MQILQKAVRVSKWKPATDAVDEPDDMSIYHLVSESTVTDKDTVT